MAPPKLRYDMTLLLAEQISVRIFQIVIQATNLVQILYRGPLPENNVGHAKFQYGRHFSRWPPWAMLKSSFLPENGSRWFEKIILIVNCVFEHVELHYSKVWIVSVWPPISKMASIGNHVILSCLKMTADGSNDDLGWYVMCFSK